MRRLTTVLALPCLFMIAPAAAMAAQPSAGEEAVTRTVEIPGTDAAVTLPTAWRIWLAEEAGHSTEIMATGVAARRTCNLSAVEGVASAEAAAHDVAKTLDDHRDVEVIERASLSVPAGDTIRVSYRHKTAPDEPRFVFHEYYLDAGDSVAWFVCSGVEPPGDDGLSIAEAIAPTSADPPASAPFDPRVEVPDHGFAVGLGAEWVVRPWGTPGLLLGGVTVLRADMLSREDGRGSTECWIEDDTGVPSLSGLASLDDWREAFVEAAEARRQRTSVPAVTDTDLPSGDAVRADWQRFNGMPATAWAVSDGDRRVSLFCRSEEPPSDPVALHRRDPRDPARRGVGRNVVACRRGRPRQRRHEETRPSQDGPPGRLGIGPTQLRYSSGIDSVSHVYVPV